MPLNPGADLRCDAKKHKREEEAQTGHKAKLAASKDTVKKVKTSHSGRNYFQIIVQDTQRALYSSVIKRTANHVDRHFSKDRQMAHKLLRRHSVPSTTRKRKSKPRGPAVLTSNHPQGRSVASVCAINQNPQTWLVGVQTGKAWQFLKRLDMGPPRDPRGRKTCVLAKMCPGVSTAAARTAARAENSPNAALRQTRHVLCPSSGVSLGKAKERGANTSYKGDPGKRSLRKKQTQKATCPTAPFL